MTQAMTSLHDVASTDATIPKEMAEASTVPAGDQVSLTATEQGLPMSPDDAETDEALVIADRTARTYRNALRELAQ